MNGDAGGKTRVSNFNRLLIVSMIIILSGGIMLTIWTAQHEDSRLRNDLLIKSRLVNEGFTTDQVKGLTGSEADLSSPDYIAVKEELIRVRSADPFIRFLYFMGQRPDGAIILLVDSELPESEDYSPPGQEFSEVTKELLDVFLVTRVEMTEGPVSDRWGTWVSGIIPVIDPATGNVVAVFGMDIDAQDWNMHIITTCLPVATGTLILLFILLVLLYIHQRNEDEKQILEKSEHRLNDIINFLPDATFVIDLGGRVIKWNRAMVEMTGVRAVDILGKGNYEYALPFYGIRRPILINLIREPDSEIAKKYTGGVHEQGNMLITETELRQPDGSVVVLGAVASPLREVDGTVIGAIESIRDITRQKKIENELKSSEERFRLLVQNINDGILVNDISLEITGRILEVNDRICEILGYTPEELLQMSLKDLIAPEQIDIVTHVVDKLKDMIFETELIRKDRQHIPVEISARFFELQGRPTTLAIVRDISERRMLEKEKEFYNRELMQSTEALRQTNDKLNLMNSITRHDILNQLTLILGYNQLMQVQFPDPRLQEYIGKELRAARTIQDQITFTKEYQDIGSQAPKWFNLNNIILSAAAGLSLSPITLSVNVDRFEIYADPLLEKVFFTLLENAIRHGKEVTGIVFSTGEQETGLMVIYEDNGVGVPAGHKEDIFRQKYFQHTGFGLYLTRIILSITGISISETGEPGKGARFVILVPKDAYRVAGTI
ncbi:MAG: PAS domain S-box protein [Methanoregula sp.]|jgi:PAS domain S-box-containing protein|nr:PAS domain S-box protein [Methanoregula sp.]